MAIRESGLEPPPKPDLGLEDLIKARMSQFREYMNSLDKWFRRMSDVVPKVSTAEASLIPIAVGANTTVEQQFTVVGLVTSDIIVVTKPSHQAGLGIVNVRCPIVDKLNITYMNTTGGSITPTAETYLLVSIRR